jgi:hypothetical protein
MMGTALTFETSVYFNETRGRYIPRSPLWKPETSQILIVFCQLG